MKKALRKIVSSVILFSLISGKTNKVRSQRIHPVNRKSLFYTVSVL